MKIISAIGVGVLTLLAMGCVKHEEAGQASRGASIFARAEGGRIIDAKGQPFLPKGMNLGNWLLPEGYMLKLEHHTAAWQMDILVKELVGPGEAADFWREYQDSYITRDDIGYLSQIGLNSVRVPFNFKLLTPEDHPDLWTERGFELLDRVIDWCREAGLLVILDMHAAPCGQTGTNIDDSYGHPWLFESPQCQERTISVWRRIAERYRLEPVILAYDLLNEPIPHFEGYEVYKPQLEPLYRKIVEAIREVDPQHMIFLGGARWNTDFGVFGPPFADNLAYTFHKYWMPPERQEIAEYLDFRERFNVPVWLGESGENEDQWILSFRQLLEENGVGWCFWPYKKMDATSSIRTFDRPDYWNEVIAFDKALNRPPDQIKENRPSLSHARAALASLLSNIRFSNGRENRGYIRALGLRPSQKTGDGSEGPQ